MKVAQRDDRPLGQDLDAEPDGNARTGSWW